MTMRVKPNHKHKRGEHPAELQRPVSYASLRLLRSGAMRTCSTATPHDATRDALHVTLAVPMCSKHTHALHLHTTLLHRSILTANNVPLAARAGHRVGEDEAGGHAVRPVAAHLQVQAHASLIRAGRMGRARIGAKLIDMQCRCRQGCTRATPTHLTTPMETHWPGLVPVTQSRTCTKCGESGERKMTQDPSSS